ncbi:hypothetical protein CRENBAI_006783 [Crenichthys baileyi]|uniref:Uncharacterized protein n=1 Tax=Crenichthys baileyi TaxID=28760 RepID=A0AAV9SEW2_9TELE
MRSPPSSDTPNLFCNGSLTVSPCTCGPIWGDCLECLIVPGLARAGSREEATRPPGALRRVPTPAAGYRVGPGLASYGRCTRLPRILSCVLVLRAFAAQETLHCAIVLPASALVIVCVAG